MAGRADSLSHVEVFERNRNSVQRPAVGSRSQLLLGLPRLLPSEIGGYSEKTMQVGIYRFDARQTSLGKVGGGKPSAAQTSRGSSHCQVAESPVFHNFLLFFHLIIWTENYRRFVR